jgi:hypothetical protein
MPKEVNALHLTGSRDRRLVALDQLLCRHSADNERIVMIERSGAWPIFTLVTLSRFPITAHRELTHVLVPPHLVSAADRQSFFYQRARSKIRAAPARIGYRATRRRTAYRMVKFQSVSLLERRAPEMLRCPGARLSCSIARLRSTGDEHLAPGARTDAGPHHGQPAAVRQLHRDRCQQRSVG